MSPPHFASLLLCLLLAVPGLAQTSEAEGKPEPPVSTPPLVGAPSSAQPPEEVPQPETGEATEGPGEDEPRGEIIQRPWRSEQKRHSPTVPRLLLESVGGSLGVAVGIIPGGLLVAYGLCDDCSHFSEPQLVFGFALAFAGVAGGSAVGIAGAASLVYGEGQFWPTTAGAAVGLVAGIICGLSLAAIIEGFALIPVALGPIVGGIIAYEMSHKRAVSERYRRAISGNRMVPLFTVSPKGGVIGGLAGSF